VATPIPENRATFLAREVAHAIAGTLSDERRAEVELTGVTTDSRVAIANPGGIFVALRGERFDGHSFLATVDGFAGLVVCEPGTGASLKKSLFVEVPDTLVAWGALAAAHLERWRGTDASKRVLAVTGSAGKTTTKELLAALLASACHRVGANSVVQKTRGNLNNRIGMPATAFTVDATHDFAVLELGMSVPGEIAAMAAIARPDVAVVTNVGVAHSEGVGGRDGVAKEKGDLFAGARETGIAIVNADCSYSMREVKRTTAAHVLSFGLAEGTSYRLLGRATDDTNGATLTLARGPSNDTLSIRFPLLGEHAATELLGRGALLVLANGAFVIDDTYNANPASMAAALRTLQELAPARRKVAVLGEMKELGPLAETEHDALGDAIVAAKVDVFVSCGGLLSRAAAKTRAAGVPTFEYMSAEEAATFVTSHLDSSDIVLVKGSRSIATEKVVDALVGAIGRRHAGDRPG
jgi:UDP-N-acetylmuramoyl-tripeptide--D-alanyl-D-alanine ligase